MHRVRIFGSEDGVKINGDNVTLTRSWIHDLDHPSGAHCDALHIRAGSRVLIENTRIDAYVGYSYDGSAPLGAGLRAAVGGTPFSLGGAGAAGGEAEQAAERAAVEAALTACARLL